MGSVSKQGTVVCVEKHFLGTRGAFGLHRVGAEEEDVAVGVAGGDVEVVGAPLGVEDGAVTLGLAVGLDTVAVVEEDLGGLEIPDDEMAVVSAGQEDVWQRGVRLQHVHLVLVRAQPVQQLAGVRTWAEKIMIKLTFFIRSDVTLPEADHTQRLQSLTAVMTRVSSQVQLTIVTRSGSSTFFCLLKVTVRPSAAVTRSTAEFQQPVLKLQMRAVPSLLPVTNLRLGRLDHWMLSTLSVCASCSST